MPLWLYYLLVRGKKAKDFLEYEEMSEHMDIQPSHINLEQQLPNQVKTLSDADSEDHEDHHDRQDDKPPFLCGNNFSTCLLW